MRSLYRTWISEIMLQQTTVATVSKRFDKFIDQFPHVESLASAEEKEILSAWKGLGYYRRAINLHKGAKFILQNHEGKFPLEESELKSIPGIGEYTSAALVGIGQNQPALPLDANLKRVLARYYAVKKELQKKFLKDQLFSEMKALSPRALIEAFMDLGRIHCQANRTECEKCPLSNGCLAYKQKLPLSYGRPSNPSSSPYSLKLLRVVVIQKEQVLALLKKEGEWLSGQWELPTFILHSDDNKLCQYPLLQTNIDLTNLPQITSRITRYRIQNHILTCNLEQFKKKFSEKLPWKFYPLRSQNCLLSSITLKILDKTGIKEKF